MKRGLKRLSAVLWGAFALPLLFLAAASTINPERAAAGDWMLYLGGAGIAVALHFATCWVIDGFTSPGE